MFLGSGYWAFGWWRRDCPFTFSWSDMHYGNGNQSLAFGMLSVFGFNTEVLMRCCLQEISILGSDAPCRSKQPAYPPSLSMYHAWLLQPQETGLSQKLTEVCNLCEISLPKIRKSSDLLSSLVCKLKATDSTLHSVIRYCLGLQLRLVKFLFYEALKFVTWLLLCRFSIGFRK